MINKITYATAALMLVLSSSPSSLLAAAGDAATGKALYAVCGSCHGAKGEGVQALNGPKLAGQSDWYLVRQIKNFKAGIRGSHDQDVYGKMMAPMANTLVTDQAIDDVVAYILTL